ncbi:MAG TPA: DUF4386 domain-containing protein [Thermoanaerobaculia bacterium]|nr:DUF4386 domain-containing protein [Thermoanaerobaculia bacterium]
MSSIKSEARQAGVLYLLFAIVAVVDEFLFPRFTVAGDAAATARNIMAGELTYRIRLLAGFVTLLLSIAVVVSLYNLFKEVDRKQSLWMLVLMLTGVAVSLANMILRFAPLIFLNDTGSLSAFSKPQLEALALTALRLNGSGVTLVTIFWGLWLFPFGALVIKSRYFPRVLGILLFIAGAGYVVSSVTAIALPAYRHAVTQVMMPLYFGELPIIFWLAIKGAKAPEVETGARG